MRGMHHLVTRRQRGHALLWLAALAIGAATCPIAASSAQTVAPAAQITVPCLVPNVVDGDTVDLELRVVVRVRLVATGGRGCWAPESRTTNLAEKERGLAAKRNLERMALGKAGLLSVPLKSDRLIDVMTLERILGEVYVAGKSLGDEQIRQGFASSTKGGPLGK